jgi:PAS domain S-box-containing protein
MERNDSPGPASGGTEQLITSSMAQLLEAHSANGAADRLELAHAHQLLAILPAMLFTSRPDGAWDYVNPQFCAYAGRRHEALVGRGWVELLHVDERASSLTEWQAGLRSGAPFVIEHRLRGADGVYGWFRIQCAPQRNGAGATRGWAGIAAPVESEHQVADERALRQSAERARDERESVIAIVAHELRAPLTVLLGQAKLLQRRLDAHADVEPGDRRAAATLVGQTVRLGELMGALLDVTQIDHGLLQVSRARLDLAAIVTRTVEASQMAHPAHGLQLCIDSAPIWVAGDALRLGQVLQNLLQNAAKYSPAGSEILVHLAPAGDQAQISVSDRGIGIAVEDQPALFQRFFRAGPRSGHSVAGLGLGLYICKAIMDLHGGTIAVESAEGEGCTVTLRLPRNRR